MSTDRELLELAAKAAGVEVAGWDENPFDPEFGHNGVASLRTTGGWWWNPLADDGDALRLAVKLGLRQTPRDNSPIDGRFAVCIGNGEVFTRTSWDVVSKETYGVPRNEPYRDPYGTTRLAIVLAAAALAAGGAA